MMKAELQQAESLEKGFTLACFLAPDRGTALEILTGALEKLSLQCRRERRRFYWRYNHACQPIRRITHEELDTFQLLIMLESEAGERAQEQRGDTSLRDMVVRYVKHLVQITRSMSSLYVCVGMNRLLYSYSTAETQDAYELVTQRFPGADQYRRAKKMLTGRMRERFGEQVEIIRTRHGETRFKTLEDQGRWHDLVRECLSIFSPWSTDGWCEHLRIGFDDMPRGCLPAAGADLQETMYCHIFIEPVCRGSLSTVLSTSSPLEKLSLPRFVMDEGTRSNDNDEPRGPRLSKLSEEEKALVSSRLQASAARRRREHVQTVMVVVDGVERARVDVARAGQMQIQLAGGAKLIEIRGLDAEGELLLGVHLIAYANDTFQPSKVIQEVHHGRLGLDITPTESFGDEACAVLTITLQRGFSWSWSTLVRAWRRIRARRQPEDSRCRWQPGSLLSFQNSIEPRMRGCHLVWKIITA